MDLESKELTDFVKGVLTAISEGQTEKFELNSKIEFELAIITTKEGNGKLNVFVANAGGRYEKETVSKIKFSMNSKGTGESRLVSND